MASGARSQFIEQCTFAHASQEVLNHNMSAAIGARVPSAIDRVQRAACQKACNTMTSFVNPAITSSPPARRFILQKENMDTQAALGVLARLLHCKPSALSPIRHDRAA